MKLRMFLYLFWSFLAAAVTAQVIVNFHTFDMSTIAWLTPAIICIRFAWTDLTKVD